MFKLVIQDDEGKTTVVPLIRDEITIGRKEGNTIRLTERNVSRRHARILRNNGEVQIEDLGSYNGIRVNNSRIAERVSLRVSDQVQIGDYKLYLKAEGVEQVDDARTMPIERIEAPATEVMPAISAPTPTAPMPVQGIAATPAPQANRTPAATADTDPGGRPVATAAQVAALTQPAGYGKLVVISNNFAGKEFDLTRPQMIIGRTTENDLVIDHRSISRNHAKVTRDTDTGRYTISDLQSSNGVRVNGQDYGKVELRRGDTVDLGHVRLRFVEPGEDWLFSRDAVIADVPDTGGSKKGLWIALALLVLAGGAAVFFLFGRGGGNNNAGHTDNGSANLAVASDQGSQTENPGSNVAMVQTIDAAPVENPPPPNPGDEAGRIKVECLQNISDKKWTDATTCAERLMSYDKDKAKELKAKARQELQNQLNVGKLDDAVRDQDLSGAKKALKDIEPDSVYRKDSEKKVGDLENKIVDTLKPQFEAAKRKNDCKAIATALSQARSSYGPGVADRFSSYKCEVVATNPGGDHPGGEHPHNPGTGSGTATPPPPPASCDPEDLVRKGTEQEGIGQHGAALGQFEAAMKCKGASVGRLNQMAFMASCNMKSVPNAKKYWARLSTAQQTQLLQMCVRWNITREQLEGK